MATQTIQTILFIELLGGIGDLVIALPAIHAVARSYPTAHLTVLTFAPGDQLLTTDPLIQRVICAEKGAARQMVDQLLAHERFDLIVSDTNYDGIADTIQDYQSSQHSPPRVLTNLWRSPPNHERVSDRFLNILLSEAVITPTALPNGEPEIHLTIAEKLSAHQKLGALYRPLVVLCLDVGMTIKCWSIDNFVALGRTLQQNYNATLVIPIGNNPVKATQMLDAIGGTAQVWQRGTLRELAAMLTEADLVIAADTGIAHIAAALAIPTITLFGPSWSERYGHSKPHINLQGFPECPERLISDFTQQTCWYSGECPYAWDTCLEAISPDAVVRAAATLLPYTAGLKNSSNHSISYSSQFISSSAPKSSSKSSKSDWLSIHNLLVMRLDNIGDVIMTSPALQALRQNLPNAKITLMASPSGASAASLLPWIDEVLSWRVVWQDLGKLAFDPAQEWELVEALKAHQFDAAMIFTSFSQSPHPAGFICALAGIPLRLGESKEQDGYSLTHCLPAAPDHIHQTERNLHLIESVGFKVSDRHLSLSIPSEVHTAVSKLVSFQSFYLLLNPWTSCPARNYASDRFAQAARQLSDQTGWKVVVTGVEKDRERSQALLADLGSRAIDLIGKTNLAELAALVEGASLVLTNNTSVMHIADATQTPMIVLFAGTEHISQWFPRHSQSRLLNRSTVCSPCYAMTCAHQMQCLDIEPEEIVRAGLELLHQVEVS
jgi:ADP-heptose:LPS heptosyltransferase